MKAIITAEITRLAAFIELNYTGFYKIVKKFDKKVNRHSLRSFMKQLDASQLMLNLISSIDVLWRNAEDKFKTLLAVETNTVKDLNVQLKTTVKDLNDRLRTLDKDVSDVLNANKQFFNEERAAAELKASQKEEREQIANKIAEAEKTMLDGIRRHKS